MVYIKYGIYKFSYNINNKVKTSYVYIKKLLL